MRGLTNDLEVHRDKKGKLLLVKWGEYTFRSQDDVVKRHQDIHTQLNLIMKSLENTNNPQILKILTDEAKTLRDRMTDVRQIKSLFTPR